MVEPFKDLFSIAAIEKLAATLAGAAPDFDAGKFIRIATIDHQNNELKQRSQQIQKALHATLPEHIDAAGPIILNTLGPEAPLDGGTTNSNGDGLSGFILMPICDFVADISRHDWPKAAALFEELTKRFSAEFAVRPFIARAPETTMLTFAKWAQSDNAHVRRLASEGCRPLLPWGMRLNQFVKDPSPILPILELLKNDPVEYVRRSVANNLNDIAKNHPDIVAKIAVNWMEYAGRNRERLVRHACRTLIKNGHPPTLAALGYQPVELRTSTFKLLTKEVIFGDALTFEYNLIPRDTAPHPYILDFAIHFKKANGELAPKVFKLSTGTFSQNTPLDGQKRVPIKPITTRKFYPGEHGLELFLNGKSLGIKHFELTVPLK